MVLPRVIEGERILLVQMSEVFVRDTWQMGQATTEDFLPHPDWFQEQTLAKLRYTQMKNYKSTYSWLLRAVVDKNTRKMLGHFNCHDRPNSKFLQRYHKNAVEFGYTIYPEFRRQGYAKEAVLTVMGYLQEHKLAEAVVLAAATTNRPSLTMIKSLGFKEIDVVQDGNETEKIFLLKF